MIQRFTAPMRRTPAGQISIWQSAVRQVKKFGRPCPPSDPRFAPLPAKLERVSPMHTVSRALRGERYVDAEKRKRIRALARQLGYRPNPAATRLRARRGKKAMEIREFVALLVEKKDPNWALSWKHHRNFVQGVRSRAEQFGYKLLLIWLYEPGWDDRPGLKGSSSRATCAASSSFPKTTKTSRRIF